MELLSLSRYNRHASLGNDYHELRLRYPNWSYDLHSRGNILGNDKLEIIAVHGIITWYIDQMSDIDINYPYKKKIDELCTDFKSITFYDFQKLCKFSSQWDNYKDHIKNSNGYKYNFLTSILKQKFKFNDPNIIKYFNKYSIISFYKFLFEFEFNSNTEEVNSWLLDIKKNIYQNFQDGNTILDSIISQYPCIKVWGIIFQKFKVILEKETTNNKDYIYKLDIFVDKVQQYIYSIIYNIFKNIKVNMDDDFIRLLENPSFLDYYSLDDEKLNEKILYLLS